MASALGRSVLHGDQETYDLWRHKTSVAADRIAFRGTEDNFWSMGEGEGPCGPCTEIFWDRTPGDDTLGEDRCARPHMSWGDHDAPHPGRYRGEANRSTADTAHERSEDRWLEIWNLVFMQNFRRADGTLGRLARPCVDTGMGLERVVSVLQGRESNYEVDTFRTLIAAVRACVASRGAVPPPPAAAGPRIIADHVRACTYLIADGVLPGYEAATVVDKVHTRD